jgi:hypothetical protein
MDSPVIASRITLYILAKELHISPAEAYQMPYSMVRDFMIMFSITKEEESKQLNKNKLK